MQVATGLPADTDVTNQATLSFTGVTTGFGLVASSNEVTTPIIIPKTDLAVAKSVSDPTPNVGETVTFTVALANQGPDAATEVVVADKLPARLSFVSATVGEGTYDPATGLWSLGTVASGASEALTITAKVVCVGIQINTASVAHSDQFDPDLGNNSAVGTTSPQESDLAIFKSVSDPTPNVGDTITYTLKLFNGGPDTATGVTVGDILPSALSFIGSSPSQGSYDPTTGIWTVGSVAVGSPQTITISALVVSPNPQANTARITTADQFDPDTANNTSTASIDPASADLGLVKSVDDPTPNVGATITFTVTLVNAGSSAATGVVVGDTLPAGLQFVSSLPSQGTYDPATGTWTVGAVAANAEPTLRVSARVISPDPQSNSVKIEHSDQFDPEPGNDTDSATARPLQADLAVTKSIDDPTPNVGQTVFFTVTLRNAGPDTATGVSVSDALPPDLQFVSATPSRGTYDPTSGIWSVGTVGTDLAQKLVIAARVISPGPGTNTATVAHSDQFDPDVANNSSSATTTPQIADIAVAKSVSNPSPDVGDTFVYTVTVSNVGPDFARNVVATDALPAGLTLVSSTTSQGTYDPATGRWSIGSLNRGTTANLTVLVRAVAPGTATNTVSAFADQFDPDLSNNSASSSVAIRQVTSPALVSIARFGYHTQPTTFVLGFNVPLDPTRARDIRAYRLVQLDAHGRPSKPIPIVSADYDAATKSVTLHPARRLYLYARYEVTAIGSIPNGLTDTAGVYLGATRAGAPGFDQSRVFGREILAGPNPAPSGSIGRTSHLAHAHAHAAHQATLLRRAGFGHEPRTPVHPGRISPAAVDAVLAATPRLRK